MVESCLRNFCFKLLRAVEEGRGEIIVPVAAVLSVHEFATQYGNEVGIIGQAQCEAVQKWGEPVDSRGNQPASRP